jgi:AcrR family transcriptional regulator
MSFNADRTRARIIHSALAVFSTHGKSGTRMASIAQRAGVNKALVYYHFRSKDNLYRIVFQSSLRRVIKNVYGGLINTRFKSHEETADKLLDRFWDANALIMKLFLLELTSGAEELRHVLTNTTKRNQEILQKLAAVFSMLNADDASSASTDEETMARKATLVIAHSMSQRLVDTVISNIFLK